MSFLAAIAGWIVLNVILPLFADSQKAKKEERKKKVDEAQKDLSKALEVRDVSAVNAAIDDFNRV